MRSSIDGVIIKRAKIVSLIVKNLHLMFRCFSLSLRPSPWMTPRCVSIGGCADGWPEQLPLEEVIKRPVSLDGNAQLTGSTETGSVHRSRKEASSGREEQRVPGTGGVSLVDHRSPGD